MASRNPVSQIREKPFFIEMLVVVLFKESPDFSRFKQPVQEISAVDVHKTASATFRDDAHEYARRIQFAVPASENGAKRFVFCGRFFHAEEAADLAGGKCWRALANQFVIHQSLCGHIGLSVVSCELSVISCQLSVISRELLEFLSSRGFSAKAILVT